MFFSRYFSWWFPGHSTQGLCLFLPSVLSSLFIYVHELLPLCFTFQCCSWNPLLLSSLPFLGLLSLTSVTNNGWGCGATWSSITWQFLISVRFSPRCIMSSSSILMYEEFPLTEYCQLKRYYCLVFINHDLHVSSQFSHSLFLHDHSDPHSALVIPLPQFSSFQFLAFFRTLSWLRLLLSTVVHNALPTFIAHFSNKSPTVISLSPLFTSSFSAIPLFQLFFHLSHRLYFFP